MTLSLGTAQWGMRYGVANRTGVPAPSEVAAMLEFALEAGVQSLDTARSYGSSEWLIGSLVGRHPGWRIATKLAADVDDWQLPVCVGDALVRTAQSISQSRRALRRSHLDALLLHRAHHRSACGGALWRHLRCERERGGIGALGVSAATPEEAMSLLDDPEVELIQVATSLLDQRLWRAGFFERAGERRVRVQVRSVFLQGAAYLEPAALAAHLRPCAGPLETIRARCRERGASLGEAFLAFARALPVEEVVVGCENIAQLRHILAEWKRATFSPEDVRRLAAEIPKLEADVLDPSRWPPRSSPQPALAREASPRADATSRHSVFRLPCGP